MVLAQEQGSGPVRYKMLETLRQFAAESLVESGEAADYRTAHRDYFLKLAEEAEPALAGPEQAVWLARLEAEHDNLRAALEWSCTKGGDCQAGLRLAGSLWRFWEVRSHLAEGRSWFATLLDSENGDRRSAVQAKASAGAAMARAAFRIPPRPSNGMEKPEKTFFGKSKWA